MGGGEGRILEYKPRTFVSCCIFKSASLVICMHFKMYVSCIWIIAGLMKVVLADGSLSISQYFRATDDEGYPVCSVNEPSVVIYGVRRRVSCLLEHCVPTEACLSANYYPDTGKCELFHYPPTDFFRIAGDCVHYKVKLLHYQ